MPWSTRTCLDGCGWKAWGSVLCRRAGWHASPWSTARLALHHESRPVEAGVHLGLSLGPDAAANAIHLLALDLIGAVLLLHELSGAPVFPWGSHGSYRPLSPDLLATVHVVAVFVAAESLALLRLADGVGRLQLAVEFPLLLLRVLLVGHEVTSHE